MLIYCDTSALKRPFDEASEPRIELEAGAVLSILEAVETGSLHLAGSEVLRLENGANPLRVRREWADRMLGLAAVQATADEGVRKRALELCAGGLAPVDALHVASAEACNCAVLLTCDDRMLKKAALARIPVMNPVDFVLGGMRAKL